ncbi:hypothetical protein [Rhizobium paknamense]|uniref:Transmembrane protein n=1 Tax=Rhizobium paknamense TaxID=1206817 RepID=A0ABU0IJ18_9HYPH|nr:hypothetical protein [Rhizobium paknamense]MDQ0457415.1 hypothetical protein [Rhizobium paknamense]
MQTLRLFALAAVGIAALTAAAFLTFSLTVVAGLMMTAALGWRALTMKAKPMPVYARAEKKPVRVWNDGRGTIIDM